MECLLSIALVLVTVIPTCSYQNGYSLCSNINYHYMSPGMSTRYQCQMFQLIVEEIQNERTNTENVISHLTSLLMSLDHKVDTLKSGMHEKHRDHYQAAARDYPHMEGRSITFQNNRDVPLLEDCSNLLDYGINESGVYSLKIHDSDIIMAYCDMETDGGGWTVLQRRIDGKVNFTRNWEEYTNGFGNVNGEYWIGNEYIHKLTSRHNFTLRIDIMDWENSTAYAEYTHFRIDDVSENYRLHIGGYSGTAQDSFKTYHNQMAFSTPDSDNDLWFGHCAQKDHAGWWYRSCGYSSLNGRYYEGGKIPLGPDGVVNRGILWYYWKNDYLYSAKHAEMKIRRKQKRH